MLAHSGALADSLEDASSYRAYFSFTQQADAKARVLEQLHVWLREKGWDPDLRRTGYQQRPAAELYVQHQDSPHATNFRVRLREDSSNGEWLTELTFTQPRQGLGYISVKPRGVVCDGGRVIFGSVRR